MKSKRKCIFLFSPNGWDGNVFLQFQCLNLTVKKNPIFEIVFKNFITIADELVLQLHGSKYQEFTSFWVFRKYFLDRQMPKALLASRF